MEAFNKFLSTSENLEKCDKIFKYGAAQETLIPWVTAEAAASSESVSSGLTPVA